MRDDVRSRRWRMFVWPVLGAALVLGLGLLWPGRAAQAFPPLYPGEIDTIAGTGQAGFSGDGGSGTEARLNGPTAVAVDDEGNVYISDQLNHVIRRVDEQTGVIETVAGSPGVAGFRDGASALFNQPVGLAFDPGGRLLIADAYNHRVRRLNLDTGVVETIAGNGVRGGGGDGGEATAANLAFPWDVAVGPDGTIYIADQRNQRIRLRHPSGIIQSHPLTGLVNPASVEVSADGTVFVADVDFRLSGSATDRVLMHRDGFTTVLVSDVLEPRDLALDAAGHLLIADRGGRILRVDAIDGTVSVAAGAPGGSSADELPATEADIATPAGVGVGRDNTIFVAEEYGGNRVRRIWPVRPVITSVDSDLPDGKYGGGLYELTVRFSERVVVDTSVPQLPFFRVAVEPGNYGMRAAFYRGGNGTDQLRFRVWLAPDDATPDLATALGTLNLRQSSIRSFDGVDADLRLPVEGAPGSLSFNGDLVFPGVPFVTSVSSPLPSGRYGGGAHDLTVRFNEPVVVTYPYLEGVTARQPLFWVALDPGNNGRRAASYMDGSGTNTLRFRFWASGRDASADLATTGGAILPRDTRIRGLDGREADLGLPTEGLSGSLSLNRDLVFPGAPFITNVSSPLPDGVYPGGLYELTVRFSEAVVVDTSVAAQPFFRVLVEPGNNGMRAAFYRGGSGTNTLTFRVWISSTDRTPELATDGTRVLLRDSSIRGLDGVDADLQLPAWDTPGSLTYNKDLVFPGS